MFEVGVNSPGPSLNPHGRVGAGTGSRAGVAEALWPSAGGSAASGTGAGFAPVKGVYRPNLVSPAFRSKNGQPTELAEQFGLVQWVRLWGQGRGVKFFAVPNGGKRDHTEAAMKLMEGMTRGVPDLWFPQRRRGYAGLVIEMKTAVEDSGSVACFAGHGGWGLSTGAVVTGKWRKGVVSDEQREWLTTLADEGYSAVVCEGMQVAMRVLEWYYG